MELKRHIKTEFFADFQIKNNLELKSKIELLMSTNGITRVWKYKSFNEYQIYTNGVI